MPTTSSSRGEPGGRNPKTSRGLWGATLAVVVVAMLALLLGPTTASPKDKIVIQSGSPTHLRLTVNGGDIVVGGSSVGSSQGCGSTDSPEFRGSVSCPAAGASSIEITTGPDGDKVEVLDPLPIPLTVHLGGGSDKFIGNGEDDTCYPEGAKRNRCYGGAGDDICITGQQNSDCVGDGGDDYCRHGAGSDGCWGDCFGSAEDPCQGKPGDDICQMGPGKDGCHGGAGDDRLYEGTGTGKLYGGPGHDFCDGGPGVGRSAGCEAGPGD